MAKYFYIINFLFFLFSCNTDSTDDQQTEVVVQDTVYETANAPNPDSALVIKNVPSVWRADFEETSNSYKIHKPADARLDTLSGERLVSLINISWDSIRLDFNKISHDTIYVSIPDSRYLTQNIGSTGAENYMATTTFSLTEIKGIKYVNYRFREGDHAAPGTYSRDSFKNFQ